MPAALQSFVLVFKQDLSQVVIVSTLTVYEISKHTGAHHVQIATAAMIDPLVAVRMRGRMSHS